MLERTNNPLSQDYELEDGGSQWCILTSKGLMSQHPSICQAKGGSNVFTLNPENRN